MIRQFGRARAFFFGHAAHQVDHAALHHALKLCREVWCVFVFDTGILDPLPRADRRVEFIHDSLVDLDAQLRALGTAQLDALGTDRARVLDRAVRHQ